jgi:hypothetical protein
MITRAIKAIIYELKAKPLLYTADINSNELTLVTLNNMPAAQH